MARSLIFLSFSKFKNCLSAEEGGVVAERLSRCPVHEEATERNTAKRQDDEVGSQPMEFDVRKDLVFALRELRLKTKALQGADYNGSTAVREDQQAALWKLRVRGHRCRASLVECEGIGEAYKQANETSGHSCAG